MRKKTKQTAAWDAWSAHVASRALFDAAKKLQADFYAQDQELLAQYYKDLATLENNLNAARMKLRAAFNDAIEKL